MPARKRKQRPPTYSWALDPGPTDGLSDAALDGLDYAAYLAEDALRRRRTMFSGDAVLPPLTIEEIAEVARRAPADVRRCIRRARTELYGNLSDAGIYYRRRRRKQLLERPTRACAQPDCPRPLPWDATTARKYCDHHSSGAARTARSRTSRPR